MEPDVFIFDEPTSSLDQKEKKAMIDFFNELNVKGKTVILSTHDNDFAYSWANEIIIMKNGSILKTGTPFEIFKDSSLLSEGIVTKPLVLEIAEELKIENHFPKNKIITKKALLSFLKNKSRA
jgi:cobalt/nickel transport system ATP-binding protein